ncbi:MAG: PRD domain-containing protein [Anaerostipes sp.]|nr:PRD domain-containing protein [Anaerostipes sp.]
MKLFSEENRMAMILRSLENQRICDVEKIADRINVSSKTIRNDVKELNCLMGGYAVISNKKSDYKLIVFNQTGYEEIRDRIYQQEEYFNSPQTRMAYIFWQLMDAKHPYLIDDLAEEMKVGRTTTNSDLKKLRESIRKYDLDIVGRANTGLTLDGDELNIRFYLLENVYEQIYLNFPLGAKLRRVLYKMQEEYSLDALGFGLFYRSFVIMIDRLQNKHYIKELGEKYLRLEGNPIYKIVHKLSLDIENLTGILIPKYEKIYLCLPLVGMRTPANIKGIENYITISEDAADLIIEILNRIKDELGVDVVVNELFDDFVYHVFFMINRLNYGIHIRNEIVDDIRDEYSLAYKMAQIAKEVIEKTCEIKVSKDEMGFLAAYFGVFLIEQTKEQRPCKIAIVCGSGKIIGRLIANQVKNIFEIEPIVKYYYDNHFKVPDDERFDFIITTNKSKIQTSIPVIYTDEVFDKQLLKSKILSVKYLKKMNIPVRQGIDSLFLNMIDENRFYILDSELSYEENMIVMSDDMVEKGYLDQDFTKRLLKREEESTMIFDENIAFPHTTTTKQNLCLGLGIYKKTESSSGEGVKLIIILGIPESLQDDSILVQLYDDVLSIANRPDVVEKLRDIDSYRDLLIYFSEENNIFR